MSEPNSAGPPEGAPFPALPALHAAHIELVRRQRELGTPPELAAEIAEFIRRGAATGVLLDAESDRETAQNLLDYWSTILYRIDYEPPDATLAEFDPTQAPVLDNALCPYVGLDAFRDSDQGVFFGRQRTVEALLELLKTHRLVAVVGPSGSGKSSVVRAGLIPALRSDRLPGSGSWRDFAPLVPGSDPLASLARALRPPGADRAWLLRQAELLRERPGRLAELMAELGATTAVLCVDQFEEVFTLSDNEADRQAFIDNLLGLIDLPGAEHTVILTMRSDFEPFVARYPALHERFSAGRAPLLPLSAAELREAIERPAAKVGLRFEEGVVDALLHDLVGEPAALPLLQFTLLKLWESRKRNRVTVESYRRLGGGRLALARSADEFYANLIPEEQVTARRILLRMVRPGDGLEVTSQRIRRAELYRANEAHDRIDRVLDKLIGARLVRVTSGETRDDEQIEVAHEALVRNWPTLVGWLDDERAALSARRRLEAKADDWVRLGRGSSGLLDREQLHEAEHWLASPEAEYLGFNPLLPELVTASRTAIEAAEHEQEAARQRELAQARALADEQQRRAEAERARAEAESARAEAEARTRRRLTFLFRAVALATIIATLAAIWAFTAQVQAILRANELASEVQVRVTAEALANQNAATAAKNADTANQNLKVAQQNKATAEQNLQVAQTAQAIAQRLQSQAEQRRLTDRANLLSAVSGALIQSRPQLSTLMAIEAVRVHTDLRQTPTFTATAALSRALLSFGAQGQGLHRSAQPVASVAVSADGARALSGDQGGGIWLWNLADPDPAHSAVQLAKPRDGDDPAITGVALTQSGRYAFAGTADGRLLAWDTDAPEQAPRLLASFRGAVRDLQISADGRRLLASGSADPVLRAWDPNSPTATPIVLSRHRQAVTSAALSADGRYVLSGGADSIAFLWDLAARDPASSASTLTARPGGGALTRVALSPNADRAITLGEDGVIHSWAVARGQFSGALTIVPVGSVTALAIDPTGRWLVLGNPNGSIDLRALPGARIDHTLRGHEGAITALAFSQDGSRLVSAGADGALLVWELGAGAPTAPARQLHGHEGAVGAAALTPSGSRLVSGGADDMLRTWELAAAPPGTADLPADPAALTALACRLAGRNMTIAEWSAYFDQQYHSTCALPSG